MMYYSLFDKPIESRNWQFYDFRFILSGGNFEFMQIRYYQNLFFPITHLESGHATIRHICKVCVGEK